MPCDDMLSPVETEYVRLIRRAAQLRGCPDDSPEAIELSWVMSRLHAYEAKPSLGD